MSYDTGHGAILALSTSEIMGCPRRLTLPTWIQDAIDTSCLTSQTFRHYIPSDLMEPGQVVAELVYDPEIAIPVANFFVLQDMTITWPISNPTNTSPATLTSQVFITSFTFPPMATSELQIATLTLQLTGEDTQTQALFTEETA